MFGVHNIPRYGLHSEEKCELTKKQHKQSSAACPLCCDKRDGWDAAVILYSYRLWEVVNPIIAEPTSWKGDKLAQRILAAREIAEYHARQEKLDSRPDCVLVVVE